MLGSVKSLFPTDYVAKLLTSRNGKLVLVLVAGFSISMLGVGYLLQRRRRRYRAVSTTSGSFRRLNTFYQTHSRQSSFQQTPGHTPSHTPFQRTKSGSNASPIPQEVMEGEEPVPNHTHYLDTHDGVESDSEGIMAVKSIRVTREEGEGEREEGEEGEEEGRSTSSEDSFHSTMELFDPIATPDNQLYISAQELVAKGGVQCRNIRTQMLCCRDDKDFLVKVHCVRLAFDALLASSENRQYFISVGRDIMSAFLQDTGQNPAMFVERFDSLIKFLDIQENWDIATKELTARNVTHMNVYDIALDFILLDAFGDLEDPPAAIVTVLQNRWITTGMKTAALSAAIWSISKAKKSVLKHKNGFMDKFYSLNETITPTLAWGFLGTDQTLKAKCDVFKSTVLKFTRAIFSEEEVRYHTVHSLADDILRLARLTAQSMS